MSASSALVAQQRCRIFGGGQGKNATSSAITGNAVFKDAGDKGMQVEAGSAITENSVPGLSAVSRQDLFFLRTCFVEATRTHLNYCGNLMTTTLLRLLKIPPATISDYSPGMRSAVDRSALYQEAEVGRVFLGVSQI